MLIFLIILNKNIIHLNVIQTADSYYFLNLETKVNYIEISFFQKIISNCIMFTYYL